MGARDGDGCDFPPCAHDAHVHGRVNDFGDDRDHDGHESVHVRDSVSDRVNGHGRGHASAHVRDRVSDHASAHDHGGDASSRVPHGVCKYLLQNP